MQTYILNRGKNCFSYSQLQEIKIRILFNSAINILQDGCPENPKCYYCNGEDYDDTACERCWTEYLSAIVNQM